MVRDSWFVIRGRTIINHMKRNIKKGEAGNKWLFLIIACGVLIGLVIFRISGYQQEKKSWLPGLARPCGKRRP